MTVNSTGASSPTINDLMATMNTKPAGTPAGSGTDSVPADTDKFMTLLVTQLKNQDPLNPMDNAQMTSQLAQLQTVTGINKLNDDPGLAEGQLPELGSDAGDQPDRPRRAGRAATT